LLKKSYRIYSYTDTIAHLEFPKAKQVENIMELIEKELGEKELGVKRHEIF